MRSRKFRLVGVAALLVAPGCLAPASSDSPIAFGDGVQAAGEEGQFSVLGWSEADPRTAMQDALGKARQYASRHGCVSRPLRVVPGDGKDPLGRPVFTAKVFFTLGVDPNQAAAVAANSALEDGPLPTALDQRLKQMVEDGRLSLEGYEQLIAQQRARAAGEQ